MINVDIIIDIFEMFCNKKGVYESSDYRRGCCRDERCQQGQEKQPGS
jgi:hypothetical protein